MRLGLHGDRPRVSQRRATGKAPMSGAVPPVLGGLAVDPEALAALPGPAPVLAWLRAALGPGPVLRVGLADAAPLDALARVGGEVWAVPLGGEEPSPEARAVMEARPGAIRSGQPPAAGLRLVSLAEPSGHGRWAPSLAPGGALVVDGAAGGAGGVALGPVTVAVPDGTGPVAAALADPALRGPLGALLDALEPPPDRLARVGGLQGRALAAIREADAAAQEARRGASRHDAEMAALAEATAARERRLAEAHARVEALEAELAQCRRSLEERFEEIAVLTLERMAGRGP